MNNSTDPHHTFVPVSTDTALPSTPSKRSKGNAAANILNQAKNRPALLGNVAALPIQRIEHGVANGKQCLIAIFPNKLGEPDRVDLSFLLDTPNLVDLLSESFLQWAPNKDPKTRVTYSRTLNRYWCRYLRKSGLIQITPHDIDNQIISGFNTWLYGPLNKEGKGLSPTTINKALGCMRSILGATPKGSWIAQLIPAGPIGASRKHVPTTTLIDAEMLRVIQAVDMEILVLQKRWERGRALLTRGYHLLNTGATLETSPGYRDEAKSDDNLALCLAILDATFPAIVPDLKVIRKRNKLLGRTIQYAFGAKLISSFLQPTPRDLVPLVLNLAVATNFNPDTVLGLLWSNIDRDVDQLGTSMVEFRVKKEDQIKPTGDALNVDEKTNEDFLAAQISREGYSLTKIIGDKPRSNRQLVRLLDPRAGKANEASIKLTLDLVSDMTARIRPHVWSDHSDRLFLFVTETRSKLPKGFGYRNKSISLSGDDAWIRGLKRFISDNDLPKFTLKNIRATLMSLVQIIYPGDLKKAQEMGNHNSFIVSWNHYTSDMVRKLVREHTGAVLLARERWLQTKGKIDPRKTAETADKGCATPGFGCFDPFDSPRPNQNQGRLCDAYGECPSCPLAMPHPGKPEEVVYWEALVRAIYRSHSSMTREMWIHRWAPILSALKELIALVPLEILEASRRYHVELPNVG